MGCPICQAEPIPVDASVVDKQGKRVIVRGQVYAKVPPDYTYSPYKHYGTVSLYPRKGKVKYLKFKTMLELERWNFQEKGRYVVQGCMHIVDGKELIFDIKKVESD